MRRYVLTLDLIDDPKLIEAYDLHHEKVWPEIVQSIKNSGIANMEIYRFSNRLTMLVEAADDFSFEAKALADAANLKVQEWENLMWKYQQALPKAKPGEKWMLMDKIFTL